jgi:hypothetical protein
MAEIGRVINRDPTWEKEPLGFVVICPRSAHAALMSKRDAKDGVI